MYGKRHEVSDKIVHHSVLGHSPLTYKAIGLDVNSEVAGATFAAGVTGMQVRFILDFKVGWA